MIGKDYAIAMSRYNEWQNRNLYGCAAGLSDEARKADRGAFFKSIHATFSHLLWADMIWMSRFAGTPKPPGGLGDSSSVFDDFETLARERVAMDARIIAWARDVDPAWFSGDLTWWSGLLKAEVGRPKAQVVAHFFNHQTHHRGQAHAMLTAAGATPEDTDLMLMELG